MRLIINSYFVGCTTGRSAGLAPLRILPGVNSCLAIPNAYIGTIAGQAAHRYKFAVHINRWQRMAFRQPYYFDTVVVKKWVRPNHQRTDFLFKDTGKCGVYISLALGVNVALPN